MFFIILQRIFIASFGSRPLYIESFQFPRISYIRETSGHDREPAITNSIPSQLAGLPVPVATQFTHVSSSARDRSAGSSFTGVRSRVRRVHGWSSCVRCRDRARCCSSCIRCSWIVADAAAGERGRKKKGEKKDNREKERAKRWSTLVRVGVVSQ